MAIWSHCLVAGIIINALAVPSDTKDVTTYSIGTCRPTDMGKGFLCTGLARWILIQQGLDYEQVAQEVCRPNRTKEIVECVEHINSIYYCRYDRVFQMFVQTDRVLEFIDYFCNQSQQVFIEKGLCINQAFEASRNCSAEAARSLTALLTHGTEEHEYMNSLTVSEGMALLCSHNRMISSCHVDSVKRQCGIEASVYTANHWRFENQPCYAATPSEPETTSQLYTTDKITSNQTHEEGVNSFACIHQSLHVTLAVLILLTESL